MPGYTTLYLLGVQEERFEAGCIVIQSRANDLKDAAMRLHKACLAEPTLSNQREYAHALKAWARETRNPKVRAHAETLLEVAP